jgi:GNAT superfamily N-acetyltransferase
MVESSTIEIRPLRVSDIAAAMRLKELAGWNQTEQDWKRLLRLEPGGCFCATINGEVVGTTTTTTYGSELAWIGMVLVDPEYRRRGIAKRLLHVALEYLQHVNVATIKLDATQDGHPVYEGIGFTLESRVERWHGTALARRRTSDCKPLSPSDLAEILEIDLSAFSANRSKLIESLIADACVAPIVSIAQGSKLNGYALARRGSNATYIGPLIASNSLQVESLLDGLLEQLAGQGVYVDLNMEFKNGAEILARRGFAKQRDLDRMIYGKATGPTSKLVFAIAGPELG